MEGERSRKLTELVSKSSWANFLVIARLRVWVGPAGKYGGWLAENE